jgi:hypothetical protein
MPSSIEIFDYNRRWTQIYADKGNSNQPRIDTNGRECLILGIAVVVDHAQDQPGYPETDWGFSARIIEPKVCGDWAKHRQR